MTKKHFLVTLFFIGTITPFVTATVLLGGELSKTKASLRQAQEFRQDYVMTEEARQSLNDQLWEERQNVKRLEEEIAEWKVRYDQATSDRERIRTIQEQQEQEFLLLVDQIRALPEEQFVDFCSDPYTGMQEMLPPNSSITSSFLTSFATKVCIP